ncbi:MAG: hypothetical protein HOF74_04355 [Gammaproteobacteria bacterium]|nr:hypothetical protein [Gammaproteobacteria bacterium]MBT3859040.1 hypothetical protein [Gammaproteobacteria bacterium]MBT3987849.1 hypothetical protein [Gammaproteobacteria bacterium]MBT4254442.1 hypothetical protein [Gammaproteobacteria bacterium]MBT4583287.1 hypothetical protein [Gammaproteobacteria bacterium]
MKTRQGYFPALVLQLLMLVPMLSHAQLSPISSDSVEAVIASASTLLRELDQLAAQCQQDSAESETCDNFLQAIDGSLIADYLEQCSQLNNWKKDMLAEALNSNSDSLAVDSSIRDIPNSSTQLRRVAGIENLCDDAALENNTQFVFTVFNDLRQQGSNSRTTDSVSRRVTDLEFSILENAERRSLQNSFQQEQLRRQLETEQQINSQQNDLLRKQIERQQIERRN